MSKMKDLQITLDDARELVEKFAAEHKDVKVEFQTFKSSVYMFDVTVRDKTYHYGLGRAFSIIDLNTNGISALENTLNYFYDCVCIHREEHRKELEV